MDLTKYELKNLKWSDLARLGTECQGSGEDVSFVIGLDGTRWCVQAFSFTDGWMGAPQGEYVLIVLGSGAYAGRAYPFRWLEGDLHSGYVGQKMRIERERDANDLARILATFLGRTPAYPVGSSIACYTEEAKLAGDATIVVREA